MVQNVGRLIALTAILLLASLVLIIVPTAPLRLGLDLAGGTRLVYRFDLADARDKGLIGADESDAQVLQQQIEIIRNRIDPQGVTEPILRPVGGESIEIALPKAIETRQATSLAPLAQTLEPDGRTVVLQGELEALAGFPGGGGVISIGAERLRYSSRVEQTLSVETRGYERTTPTRHEAGELVTLVSDDAIKNAIENLGDLRFLPLAKPTDFTTRGADSAKAREKLVAWLNQPENKDLPIAAYNRLPYEQGGPPPGISWYPYRPEEGQAKLDRNQRPFEALVQPQTKEWIFSGADLARVYRSQDSNGLPAVGFEMSTRARIPFGDFTEAHVDEQVAIVLNDEIVSAPVIQNALRGPSIIQGPPGKGFTDREVAEMVTVLRSGSLKIKPMLEQEERVGATLGDDYVQRGIVGGFTALGGTLLFMLLYFRRLGLFACIALACNLLMLVGAMIFVQATLTLPGIAGIILTVGMAVDANILIFDRLREEAEKGHKVAQAAKEGFNNALSAIVDGNVTTLITALILYNIGTGPIRGFAVTLSIGILTSMFAALVVTRLLVHMALASGVQRFGMSRWLADANFRFVRYGKQAVAGSALAIILGVGLFIALPTSKKLGIDFLGGASLKVRTEQALTAAELRALVANLPGELAQAEVASLPGSSAGAGRYREFRITFKTSSASVAQESEGSERNFEREVRQALAGVLQKGPIEASVDPASLRADMVLYFEQPHSVEDVRAKLEGTPLVGAQVSQREGVQNVFTISSEVTPGTEAPFLQALLSPRFEDTVDAAGRDFSLANPIAETNVIGAQVVGELRDSAIQAILLSIFLTVIYIRVRFAEYSYGWAAVVAVVHDVLTTLGAVAVLIAVPWIQVEMNLTLIAAFLTIFGYSLNDTIVIFDRVRENLPRVKGSLAEVVDLSINLTLSRTICTSGTTLLATFVVLIFNFGTGNALEGFGFAMSFGILTGTYSTIWIACPLLVWMEERKRRKLEAEKSGARRGGKSAEATSSAS